MGNSLPVVSFYIAAHQDDWQLFRGNWAWNNVKAGANVVFVYITAGDGGDEETFWRAREAAAMASVETITLQPAGNPTQVNINGKLITIYQLALTRSYFLRLPDGGYIDHGGIIEGGKGHERTGFQSLTLLRAEGKRMVAVDGSASYGSWQELVDTVSGIVARETKPSSSKELWINTSRRDRANNPNDHFDHYEVGEIVAAFNVQQYQLVGWAGYSNRTRRVELGELEKKRDLMAAYRRKMKALVPTFNEAETSEHDEGYMNPEGE